VRPTVIALSCLTAVAPLATTVHAAVENVAPSAVSLETLGGTELKDASPEVVRLLALADDIVQQGVKYRRLKSARQLSPEKLGRPLRRLSCSEFVWSLFSLAGFDMGDHPVSSRRLAFAADPYPRVLAKVTDGSLIPGDVLVYGHPADALAGQKVTPGTGEVNHVVVVVSAKQAIVVGSHGRESTAEGGALGAGYRHLVGGFGEWSHGRVLMGTFRLKRGLQASAR
jgi:hypothetical protein